jgi:hypothetical protein
MVASDLDSIGCGVEGVSGVAASLFFVVLSSRQHCSSSHAFLPHLSFPALPSDSYRSYRNSVKGMVTHKIVAPVSFPR